MRLQSAVLLAILLCLGTVTWRLSRGSPDQAPWLRVEAAAYATVGQAFPMRIELDVRQRDAFLAADLHWMSSRGEPRGFLGAGLPQPIGPRDRIYRFNVPVPAHEDLGSVQGIIYLTTTGDWQDRIEVAVTAPIPVTTGSIPYTQQLHPLAAYEPSAQPAIVHSESPIVRILIGSVWLICGVSLRHPRVRSRWRWLSLMCFAAVLWEFSNAQTLLADRVRAVAVEERFYFERREFQQALTLMIVVGTAGTAVAVARRVRDPGRSFALLGLCSYSAAALLGLVSLHEVDSLMFTPVLGIPSGQIAKLAAAAGVTGIAGRAMFPPDDGGSRR